MSGRNNRAKAPLFFFSQWEKIEMSAGAAARLAIDCPHLNPLPEGEESPHPKRWTGIFVAAPLCRGVSDWL
jgi:hypothetical protein